MPSLMATSLHWRTHYARTNKKLFENMTYPAYYNKNSFPLSLLVNLSRAAKNLRRPRNSHGRRLPKKGDAGGKGTWGRKLTNPMPPGSYYTKPKKSDEMIAAGGASPNLLPIQFGDLSIEFGGPPQFGGITQPFGGAIAKRSFGSSLSSRIF
jgi:hypothetical protein